jgi:hypothetical protein
VEHQVLPIVLAVAADDLQGGADRRRQVRGRQPKERVMPELDFQTQIERDKLDALRDVAQQLKRIADTLEKVTGHSESWGKSFVRVLDIGPP